MSDMDGMGITTHQRNNRRCKSTHRFAQRSIDSDGEFLSKVFRRNVSGVCSIDKTDRLASVVRGHNSAELGSVAHSSILGLGRQEGRKIHLEAYHS